jgi:hypothetical protein
LAGKRNAVLTINRLTITVNNNKCGHAPNAVARGSLPAYPTPDINTNHLSFIGQLRFHPVNDRLCQEARASKVGVEFNDHRLACIQSDVKRFNRVNSICGARS